MATDDVIRERLRCARIASAQMDELVKYLNEHRYQTAACLASSYANVIQIGILVGETANIEELAAILQPEVSHA